MCAYTKLIFYLHNAGTYKCHYANSTVCDLTAPSVSSLSWSTVAFSRSISMELDSERFIVSTFMREEIQLMTSL